MPDTLYADSVPPARRLLGVVGQYALSVALVAVALILRWKLNRWLGSGAGFILLVPVVLFTAVYGGWGPSVVAVVLGALGSDYFFLSPHGQDDRSLFNNTPEDTCKIALFVVISIGLIVVATARRRVGLKLRQSEADLRRAHAELETRIAARTSELANTNQRLVEQIAEREHAQSELRRVTAQARCILWTARIVGQPGWQQDVDGSQRKLTWTVHFLDEAAAREIVELDPRPGLSFNDTLASRRHPDDDNAMARVAAEAFIAGRSSYCQEFRFTGNTGEERWLFEDVHIVPAGPDCWNATGILTDITARKRDQIERQRAEKELHNISAEARCILWHGTIEGVPGWDDPSYTGNRFHWSFRMHDEQAAQRVLPLDVTGGDYAHAWYLARMPEESARMDRTSEAALLGGAPGYSQEFRCHDRHGQLHWLLEAVSLEKRSHGKWYAVAVCTDITERKQAEEQRAMMLAEQAARAQAEAASRAKDQFLAVLSHELRTPLTAVLMTASALEEDPLVPMALRSSVEMIRRNVELEARLIDDLLDSNRIAAGKVELNVELLDVHAVLHRAAEVCQSDCMSKRLELVWELNAEHHFVRGDVVRLQQIFWNLIRNAVKFTPEGGRITVRTDQGSAAESGNGHAGATSAPHSSPSVIVSVTDTGIGIERDVLPRVFQAFEQGGREVTRQFGGLGLGLAISKALVDLHGGAISAHSTGRGAGATFTVVLETTPEPAPAAAPKAPRVPVPAGTHGLRILLVEDHIDTQRATARFLRSLGHEVRGAASAADARKAAAGESFDLIISDLGLPDGSGLDLMRQLRSERQLRGIALSGYGMEEDVRNSRDAGFDYHLTKPVPAQQLEALLQQLAGKIVAEASV